MRPSLALLPYALLPLAALWLALAGAVPAAPPAGWALSVTVGPQGVSAEGELPAGFDLDELARRVPGIDLAGAVEREGDDGVGWARALDALTVVLPRLAAGEARLLPGRLEVTGRLRPGFSAGATRSALRLALAAGWEARLDLAEAPPSARLELHWTAEGGTASGILPDGLTPEEALALMTPGRAVTGSDLTGSDLTGGGLTGGGGGDRAAWRAALGAVGRLLPAFRRAELAIAPGRFSIVGRLAPGQKAARLSDWLGGTLGEGWEVHLAVKETLAAEGATRYDPVTGGMQRFVSGRWLPQHDFAPSPAACGRRSAVLLARAPLRFVAGAARLDGAEAGRTLDRLAGLARHCLNRGGLSLEIGGHTDSRGDPEANHALSERRALTVLLELAVRGVRADAMHPVGHGARRAIAGNDSPEGRARNRRITLDWSR